MCSNAPMPPFICPLMGGHCRHVQLRERERYLCSCSDKVCLVPLTCGWHSKRRKQRSLFILCLLTTAPPPQSPCKPHWSLSSPLESRAAAAEEDSMTETNPLHPNTRMHQQNIIKRNNKIRSRGATTYHMKIWSQLNEIYSNLGGICFFAILVLFPAAVSVSITCRCGIPHITPRLSPHLREMTRVPPHTTLYRLNPQHLVDQLASCSGYCDIRWNISQGQEKLRISPFTYISIIL